MAPNRRAKNDHHGNQGGPPQNGRNGGGNNGGNRGMASVPLKCVRPKGCLEPKRLIYMEDIQSGSIEVVRLTCNNLQCDQGNFMHTECFMDWETTVLNFLSSTGRARSWSVKQRQQNLWTKKGYDLAFKACDCNCGKGHLRKDLDWIAPSEKVDRRAAPAPVLNGHANGNGHGVQNNQGEEPQNNVQNGNVNQNQNAAGVQINNNNAVAGAGEDKKKKKKKGKENLPTLSLSAPVSHPNDNHNHGRKTSISTTNTSTTAISAPAPIKTATGGSPPSEPIANSVASSSGSSGVGSLGNDPSPPASAWSSSSPWNVPGSMALYRPRVDSLSSNASGSSGAFSGSTGSPPSPEAQFGSPISASSIQANIFKFQRKNSNSSGGGGERTRHNSTGSMFCRRNDFSSFNFLPKQRQNSYHIKMDDEGREDDVRFMALATLQHHRITKVQCCMCQGGMAVYDRYPLIDGVFFMSPRRHGKDSIPMTSTPATVTDSAPRYLTSICMHCLSGKNGGCICRGCGKAFDGSALILGAIYTYDVFAGIACCRMKSECVNCKAVLAQPHQFFHQGSQLTRCARCGMTDFHFAKPVNSVYEKIPPEQFERILEIQKIEEKVRWSRMYNQNPRQAM